jgi:ribonuclease HII
VRFTPRADGASIAVAVASMVCKYLRELCMEQFNGYWGKHVPGLKPTAGYPTDAKRYFEAIREPMVKLGLKESDVWRVK